MKRKVIGRICACILFVSGFCTFAADTSDLLIIQLGETIIEEDDIPEFEVDLDYAFSQVTLDTVKGLYLFPVSTLQDADITLSPVIESLKSSHDESNKVEVIEMVVRWDISGAFGDISFRIPTVGAAGTLNGALLNSLSLYQSAAEYEVSGALTDVGYLVISSLFNRYITAETPVGMELQAGDEFLITDPVNRKELGMLTVSDLYETESGIQAAELFINYTDVPITTGIALKDIGERTGISLKVSEIQMVSHTGFSADAVFRQPQGNLQYTAGIDLGYSWAESPFTDASGFHISLTQGFLARFDTGNRVSEAANTTGYNLFYEVGAALGFGSYLDISGSDSSWTLSGDIHGGIGWYSSSELEYGIEIGYQLMYGFSDLSTEIRSTPYLSPHVTFRL